MKKTIIAILLGTSINGFAQKKVNPTPYAATIKETELREKLFVLASAEMEGRETTTEGQRKAASYIENYFKTLGLLPANGKGGYQQAYPVYQDILKEASLKIYGIPFEFDNGFTVPFANAINGDWKINEVVFAGFGMTDASKNDYAGLDVKDKWVAVIEGSSADFAKGDNFFATPARTGPTSISDKAALAKKNGAAGIFVISKNFYNPNRFPANRTGPMNTRKMATTNTILPICNISYQAAASLLNIPLNNFSALATIKNGVYATQAAVTVNKSSQELSSTNVLGMIEGSDKKDEYLFITSHYDHLGKRGNVIYYGADDDGSGTVSVLELAEAFAQAKKEGKGPRRNIVFMTVSGEEKGLWGSEYYSNNPVFPLDKTTADLNIDMVGRIDPSYKGDSMNYVFTIGEDKLSSDLQKITDEVNKQHVKIETDRRYNDPKDPNRFYYRSDHYNFAAKGVPIIFYFNGVHRDYHQPTDTPDKINYDLMEKRVKLIFHTAWMMANKDEMLKRDMPLNMPGTN